MSIVEIKTELHKLVDDASSENVLLQALSVLKERSGNAEIERYNRNIKKIISDNRGLLQRLAQ